MPCPPKRRASKEPNFCPPLRLKTFPLIWVIILLALVATEGLSYWWMHPAPAGLGDPVLIYRPGDRQGSSALGGDSEKIGESLEGEAIAGEGASEILTPLPEIVARALPSLRCSNGVAARIDRQDGTTVHLAFFEWDLVDSTSVLEAFKHLPDDCMGSIGMTLTGHCPPRPYQVGSETLSFDHTVFREQGGAVVHAFKGTWVSGANRLLGEGIRGGGEQWREIRWRAALKRFRPAYARVAQGAVHGIPQPDRAWKAFEEAMLNDLKFEKL